MPPSRQSWTVRLELLCESQVDLWVCRNGERAGRQVRRCSIQEALRELEVLFECSGEADFFLAVRAQEGPWHQLATVRWRLALYFVISEYERAFVTAAGVKVAKRPALAPAATRVESGPVDEESSPDLAADTPLHEAQPEAAHASLSPERDE